MSSSLLRSNSSRRLAPKVSPSLSLIRHNSRLKPVLDPRHLSPGQKLHPDLLPLVNGIIAPGKTPNIPLRDIWRVIFTAPGPRDPVSTTNLKSFSEYHDDFRARDTAVICVVPGKDEAVTRWIGDIAKTTELIDEFDDTGSVSSRVLGFPVLSDPNYAVHQRLGFIGDPDPSPTSELVPEKIIPSHNLLYIISPDHTVRLTQIVPSTIGFNVLDVIRSIHALQTADDYDILMPADWTPGKDAVMPTGRRRRKEAVVALKRDVPSAAAPLAGKGEQSGVIRDKDEDGFEYYEEGHYEEEVVDRMPPGEVWEVLPYLRYVRIDDRVENSASVIGYEKMRTDLLKSFERFKTEKADKRGSDLEQKKRRQRDDALLGLLNDNGRRWK
ncbi:hypothetical protein H072_4148 [Dactylellina haptotyla CBS 200.50]|uniref:Alkyl hydroperoxide reductase subunit C/ Thiol specific antioxidant domain-containing protein n=1 Tax=Dactylellina haptotyla (strain CBS 200.50) TaxID=1284197 RepID=S8AFT8_DACHA|nr:hypothetical protein H072_4148 [Dactylellina haptotyla CBS 200.50]